MEFYLISLIFAIIFSGVTCSKGKYKLQLCVCFELEWNRLDWFEESRERTDRLTDKSTVSRSLLHYFNYLLIIKNQTNYTIYLGTAMKNETKKCLESNQVNFFYSLYLTFLYLPNETKPTNRPPIDNPTPHFFLLPPSRPNSSSWSR